MLTLSNPLILWFACIPPLIWLLRPLKQYDFGALRIPFYETIVQGCGRSTFRKPARGAWLWWLSWGLLLLAAAGPTWVGDPIPVQREARDMMLVLDISGSMALPDMVYQGHRATRLTVVRDTARAFVKARPNDRLGLILFGLRAYLMTPFTFDHHALLDRLNDATVGLAGPSTSIGDALGLAVKHLQNRPDKSRVVILLTDGVSNSGMLPPTKAATLAKEAHVKVYTIGLRSSGVSNMWDPFGSQSNTDLDETTLKQIAHETGGKYFLATDAASLRATYAEINALEPNKTPKENLERPQVAYYPWVLMLALTVWLYWLLSTLVVSRGHA